MNRPSLSDAVHGPSIESPLVPSRELVRQVAARLEAAGVVSPRVDAELLVAAAARVPRGALVLVALDAAARARLEEMATRRERREPLQHVVGTAPFRHLELAVGPGVFVPRPETEQVVDAVLAGLVQQGGPAPVVVDLCTGSGAIALAVAQEHPSATVVGIELDDDALLWARRNALMLDLPVRLEQGRAGAALPDLDGRVDVVVSNPPYVTPGTALEPEVGQHDPELALWGGGADGLDAVREVADAAWRLLRPGGRLVVEHGNDQGETAPAILADRWAEVEDHRDLAGRPRWMEAVRP